ncbi:peptidase domain-containing ABC transporter [Deinococcus psychrotolerans]|nr:peptidase domain-containing ABC transporter [Deinococcus psychrotolerans]
MILQHWGRQEPLYRLRELAGTTQGGTNLLGLKNAALALGIEASAYSGDLEALGQIDLPAILHWEHNHYVVLFKLSERFAWLADPAQGTRRVSLAELESKWTGKMMVFRPSPSFQRGVFIGKRGLRGLFAHLQHFRGTQGVLMEVTVATLLLGLLSLVAPLLSQVVFDRVLTFREVQLLPYLLGAIFGLAALQAGFGALRSYLSNHLAMSLNYRLQIGYLDHLLRLPLKIHETRLVGDFLQRFSDLDHVREVLTSFMVGVPTSVVTLIVSAGMLFFYNVQLALVASVALILDVAYLLLVAPKLRETSRKMMKKAGELDSFMIGNLEGISALKAYRAEGWALFKGRNQVSGLMDQKWKNFSIQNNSGIIFALLGSLSSMITLWYGATQVLNLKLSVGQLVATYGLVGNAVGALSSIILNLQAMQQGAVSSDRLAEILELTPENETDGSQTQGELLPLQSALRISNLSFAYMPQRPLLKEVSFSLPKGSYVALLGSNGSGKSTLCNLLSGMLTPVSGEMFWDDLPLSEYPPSAVRARIAYQRQEVPIFLTTVQDNLCMGRTVPDQQLSDVVSALGLSQVIRRLPEGMNTMLGGDSPHRLSSGERQMFGLARALLSDADVLILDEPTATLDMEREARVVNLLTHLKGYKTILVITHRPALIGPADHVLELHDGVLSPSSSTLAVMNALFAGDSAW